ncbi:MAG: hypothetical protein WCK89_16475, partial [bacterium]
MKLLQAGMVSTLLLGGSVVAGDMNVPGNLSVDLDATVKGALIANDGCFVIAQDGSICSAMGIYVGGYQLSLANIAADAYGASQWGYNSGTLTIGGEAYGAEQRGYLAPDASAANTGAGSIQLLNLADGQQALIVGSASIGLGACTVVHDQAIVAGDGLFSCGNGTITAVGFYGDGAGLTNLSGARFVAHSIGSEALAVGAVETTSLANEAVGQNQLAAGGVTESKLATGAVTAGKLAIGSVGTNKAVVAEWNSWGNGRYMLLTGSPDLILNPGRTVAGYGLNVMNISVSAYGAEQRGYRSSGAQTIGPYAYGAEQRGYNYGTQTMGSYAYGAEQRGYNYGAQTMGSSAYGAEQRGYNYGTQT